MKRDIEALQQMRSINIVLFFIIINLFSSECSKLAGDNISTTQNEVSAIKLY